MRHTVAPAGTPGTPVTLRRDDGAQAPPAGSGRWRCVERRDPGGNPRRRARSVWGLRRRGGSGGVRTGRLGAGAGPESEREYRHDERAPTGAAPMQPGRSQDPPFDPIVSPSRLSPARTKGLGRSSTPRARVQRHLHVWKALVPWRRRRRCRRRRGSAPDGTAVEGDPSVGAVGPSRGGHAARGAVLVSQAIEHCDGERTARGSLVVDGRSGNVARTSFSRWLRQRFTSLHSAPTRRAVDGIGPGPAR